MTDLENVEQSELVAGRYRIDVQYRVTTPRPVFGIRPGTLVGRATAVLVR